MLIVSAVFLIYIISLKKEKKLNEEKPIPKKEETQYSISVPIEAGKTLSVIMKDSGISPDIAQKIVDASKNIYDFSTIKAGKTIYFTYDKKTNDFLRLMYPVNDEEELYVSKDIATTTLNVWFAERKKILYEIKLKTYAGKIEESLYIDGLKLGIPEGTIIEFADIFEYAVDYAYDIRIGDTFSFVVEERYRDGKFVMLGRILGGKFINAGKTYEAYYFVENDNNKGYFDEKGNSIQKLFLRAPVAFKYISSGFTTGRRYVKEFNVSTGHRAIDYAASLGTPIRSVGDGTVVFAGWSKAGFGNLTSIRHNATYQTNYAHQSKIIVKSGQRVKQGQVIGYVGSTGFSTGPHLHYEMVKNGVKINPLKEVLPPGKPIKEENKERYFTDIEKYKKIL